jgi:[acyl-carrier-protein] S-malonyltransferase
LTFEDALALVHQRAIAMQAAAEVAPGAMSAVLGLEPDGLRAAVAAARAAGRVALANFNAPGQIVISGDRDAVVRAGELALEAGAKRVVPLNVSGAWHSELMQPARERFAPFVAAAPIELPRFPVISNVDAEPYESVAHIRENLGRSVTDEVLWHAASERLVGYGLDLVVEFGGSAVLAPMLRRLPDAPKSLHAGDDRGIDKVLAALAQPASV